MKLEMREQDRDRPVALPIGTAVNKPKQIMAEIKREHHVDADNTRKNAVELNIPVGKDSSSVADLEALMSCLALSQTGDNKLRGVPTQNLKQDLVRRLRELLVKLGKRGVDRQKEDAHRKKENDSPDEIRDNLDADISKVESDRVKLGVVQERESGKENGGEELEDNDSDLCPRGPDRLQHHTVRLDNFPYQNASRKHHSGGSTVAYSNPITATPTHAFNINTHNMNHLNNQSCVAASPPMVIETSDVASDLGISNIGDLEKFDETDLRLLKSLATEIFSMYCNESDLPEPISEINSSQLDSLANLLDHVDRQVPTGNPAPAGLNVDKSSSPRSDSTPFTGRPYPEDSPSGYYSLSPNSVLSSSPGGSHDPFSPGSTYGLPDDSNDAGSGLVPDISRPGQFSDIPFSTNYNLSVNIYANDLHFDDGSSGYSSISTPSPTVYKSANFDQNPQDFETECQIASNAVENQSNIAISESISNLLPTYENVFDSDVEDFISVNECPQTNQLAHNFSLTSMSTASTLEPKYTSNLQTGIPTSSPTYLPTENANIATCSNDNTQFNNHSTIYVTQNNSRPNVASPNSNFTNAEITRDLNNVSLFSHTTFPSNQNATTNHPLTTFDSNRSIAAPLGAASVQLGILVPVMQARLVTPMTSNLKRLEPKLEKPLNTETGKERVLKMMDEKKKAEAWIKVSLKLKEAAEKDKDGDTQLMILCANAKGSVVSYMLEYIYALVEMLKGVPNALSAVNNQQHSALYLAALHSDYVNRAVVVRYIAETLIELGENIDHVNADGNSMLHDLGLQGDQRYDVLVELLSLKNQDGKPYFDVNKYNAEGKTVLHLAASSHGTNGVSCHKTVRLLVAEGADVSLPEMTRSNTALHVAIEHSCDPSLVQALLSGPNQNDRTCNMLNQNKDSPLHCAASRNDLSIEQQGRVIEMLMDPRHGTAKNTNASGKYPIQLVAEERRQKIRCVYETRKGNQGYIGGMM